ncbi:MAG TPA: GNAT family N-acetyltransferase [Gemmatimonadales bacterium]|nr:GNAT family N-acetyltransferase [Gemmatimonadales bacterium]
MSHEALSPRQFGPGGKYTSRPVDMYGNVVTGGDPKYVRGLEAVHTASGRGVGRMNWFGPAGEGGRHVQGSPDPTKPAIFKVVVSKPQRRKGIATAMLEHARDIAPGLQHSGPQALSPEGAAWARNRP